MIYLYDRIVHSETYEIEYLGSTYKLTGVNHMNSIDYYSYSLPGAEPILVTSYFAEQFLEAAKKTKKVRSALSPKAVEARLTALFGQKPEVEVYDFGESKIYHYATDYKNIRITMQLENNEFYLEPSFVIQSGTILGKYIPVSVLDNEELMAYCHRQEE